MDPKVVLTEDEALELLSFLVTAARTQIAEAAESAGRLHGGADVARDADVSDGTAQNDTRSRRPDRRSRRLCGRAGRGVPRARRASRFRAPMNESAAADPGGLPGRGQQPEASRYTDVRSCRRRSLAEPMSQLPLFARSSETVVVDDARGRIVYTPDFVPPELAHSWFHQVRRSVTWEAQRRWMYDHEVDVPRLVGHFRLAADAADVPDVIRAAAQTVSAATGVAFTSVGLNFYRDGRDSVAPHNDHLDEIAPGSPIALLSLGATRRMTIRAKAAPRRVFHVDLAAGSRLVMGYETQLHYTHGVPKTREPVGPRISFALRVRPEPT